MDFQAWYFLDLEALESLIIVNRRDTTRAGLRRVPLHLHTNYWYHQGLSPFATENCTTDRECVYTSRAWASESGTKRRRKAA